MGALAHTLPVSALRQDNKGEDIYADEIISIEQANIFNALVDTGAQIKSYAYAPNINVTDTSNDASTHAKYALIERVGKEKKLCLKLFHLLKILMSKTMRLGMSGVTQQILCSKMRYKPSQRVKNLSLVVP